MILQAPKVFFDEAGNTGDNLLDKEQPIYVLSSNDYSDAEIQQILSPLSIAKGNELHFKNLKKYSKYRNAIIDVFNHDLITSEHIKYSYADKKFGLVCNIVDKIIEPMFYDVGYNMYKKGLNLTYANGLYIVGISHCNKELFSRFLFDFQSLMREQTASNINSFYRTVEEILLVKNEIIEDIFSCIAASKAQIIDFIDGYDKYSMDFSVSTFAILCDWWGKQLNKKFEVIHDNSKQIEHWEGHIKSMSNDKIKKTEIGYDYRKSTYPLLIESLTLVDSKSHKQIQFADIVSSAVSYCLKIRHIDKNETDDFANKIFTSKLANITSWPIMPSAKITPEELGTVDDKGIDAVDFMTLVAGKHFEK